MLQEPAAGAEAMDVEEIMGKLGLELNEDQKKRWSWHNPLLTESILYCVRWGRAVLQHRLGL